MYMYGGNDIVITECAECVAASHMLLSCLGFSSASYLKVHVKTHHGALLSAGPHRPESTPNGAALFQCVRTCGVKGKRCTAGWPCRGGRKWEMLKGNSTFAEHKHAPGQLYNNCKDWKGKKAITLSGSLHGCIFPSNTWSCGFYCISQWSEWISESNVTLNAQGNTRQNAIQSRYCMCGKMWWFTLHGVWTCRPLLFTRGCSCYKHNCHNQSQYYYKGKSLQFSKC